MFEPGDWVIIDKEWTYLRVGLVGQVLETNEFWVWVQIDDQEKCWPTTICRKLTEHEVMERLRDV
jgi:hypothetical protein